MCVVSMVFDYGSTIWPIYPAPPSTPWAPNVIPKVPSVKEWKEFLELVEKAKKFDDLTGQPDCEDPAKATWMKDIEERLDKLEGPRCR